LLAILSLWGFSSLGAGSTTILMVTVLDLQCPTLLYLCLGQGEPTSLPQNWEVGLIENVKFKTVERISRGSLWAGREGEKNKSRRKGENAS
jgi:hypothetical protein